MIVFADIGGELAGFGLALPDLNVALKKMNGSLFPFGWAKALWYSRKIDTARVLTLGVLEKFRRSGVGELHGAGDDDQRRADRNKARGVFVDSRGQHGDANSARENGRDGLPHVPDVRRTDRSRRAVPERSRVALVTGATGFIGSHLVEALLSRGWRVRCLVRKTSVLRWLPTDDVSLINGDVGLPGDDLERAVRNVSVVFHLAGLTSATDDSAYTTVNVEGTRNVVVAMQKAAPESAAGVLLESCRGRALAPRSVR